MIDRAPKALQVYTAQGTRHWLPRSQIVEFEGESYLIPMWLAETNGIARTIEAAVKEEPA